MPSLWSSSIGLNECIIPSMGQFLFLGFSCVSQYHTSLLINRCGWCNIQMLTFIGDIQLVTRG